MPAGVLKVHGVSMTVDDLLPVMAPSNRRNSLVWEVIFDAAVAIAGEAQRLATPAFSGRGGYLMQLGDPSILWPGRLFDAAVAIAYAAVTIAYEAQRLAPPPVCRRSCTRHTSGSKSNRHVNVFTFAEQESAAQYQAHGALCALPDH